MQFTEKHKSPYVSWSLTVGFALLSLALLGCARGKNVGREISSWPIIPDTTTVTAPHGVVASDERLASRAGVEIMQEGGNAVDAAVATAFALAVTLPEAGNIGGGGFCVIRLPDGSVVALDFREKAPLAARRDMYLDAKGNVTDQSVNGHLAAGVPGSVAGLYEAHRRFGRLPWADVMHPAILLAREGFTVSEVLANGVREDSARLARFPGSAKLFLPGGHPVAAGSRWSNPDLARSLERIAQLGPAGFYSGETAKLIVHEMQTGGGIISGRDLDRYRAVWRTPVSVTYRGYRIFSMPPPSSGGLTIAQIANILEGFEITRMTWHSPDHIHLLAEAMRRAFADRNYWLGDPDLVEIPQDSLASKAYGATRRASIDIHRATPSAEIRPGTFSVVHESMHTTHFSVVDSEGCMVALTTTLNLGFGSAVVVEGAGFLLNNEMDDFAAKPGTPNSFGLAQGEANAIAPGKRILSSMSPTIVLDSVGEPVLITGASGGPRIITATWQIISNVLDFRMPIDSAVAAPRLHHQHLPDQILVEEGGFSAEILSALKSRGHTVREVHRLAIAPSIARVGKTWRGTADKRTDGAAVGY
jgi:gamma-glutamyltranspeptidase / glutathione hydrolase